MIGNNIQSDLSKETDEDLLKIMVAYRNIEQEVSNNAFDIFIKRFGDFIWKISIRTAYGHCNQAVLRDYLYSEVLTDIHKSKGFVVGDETDPLVRKKRIYGWIIKIAKNAYIRLLKGETPSIDIDAFHTVPYQEEVIVEEENDFLPVLSKELVTQAFEQLSERDRDIVWTYWRYYEMGEGSQAKNLPSDVLKELCERHQTTSANIRTIISRGNKTLNDYLVAQSDTQKNLQHVG